MSLGDDEHPISFRFEPEVRGDHVHVTVRAGLGARGDVPAMRALCGTLVMRREEYALLRLALATAPYEPVERVFLPMAPPGMGNRDGGTDMKARSVLRINAEPFEFGSFEEAMPAFENRVAKQRADLALQVNPPGCTCEYVHRSSATCPSTAPSRGAIPDEPEGTE